MAVEAMRGCGFRVVHGLYVCGGGLGASCDRLPYELEICPVCGSGIKFSRGWTWIDWERYAGQHNNEVISFEERAVCIDPKSCPICWPYEHPQPYGLLWVGESNYTPENFIQEALTMGISKRIPAAGRMPTGPRNLKLDETWILLAHHKALGTRKELQDDGMMKDTNVPGVFYAFRPTSLEYLIWESEATPEYIEDLEKRGLTVVVIPDGDPDHDPNSKQKMTPVDREHVNITNKIALLKNKFAR